MKIRITAGDWGGNYEAANGQEAIKLFFKDIARGKIKLCQLSPLGEWSAGGERIPFRIAPALFKLKLLSAEQYVGSLQRVGLDFEPIELMAMVTADSWMIEKV